MPAPTAKVVTRSDRIQSALLGLFTGDALAMPVHWFYRPADILKAFPPAGIVRMEAAPEHHPSSIMSLHSTRAAGRRGAVSKSTSVEVVGEVILKGRQHHWGIPNRHYHHGLPAGENTLNAWCARWLMEYLLREGDYHLDAWLDDYVARMTADPPAHPDTYAESYHRGFFANYSAGLAPRDCGVVSHDTPSMGALVTVVPLVLALLAKNSVEETQQRVRVHVNATHPDRGLLRVVDALVVLMDQLLRGDDPHLALVTAAEAGVPGTRLQPLFDKAEQKRVSDADVVGGHYSLACYIEDSWPNVCWLALRHGRDPSRALRINANLGGENAHRGAVLGSLVGLISGQTDTGLVQDLHRCGEITDLVNAFANTYG